MVESLIDKKLLLVGPSKNSVHLKTYFDLIKDHFKEVLIVTETAIDFGKFERIEFSIRNPVKLLKNIRKLKNIISEFKPDIIHAHQANSCSYITSKANSKKYPLVVTAWGSDVLVIPQKSSLLKKMVQSVLSTADVVTADAKYMIETIQELNPGTKTVHVNFGIDLEDVVFPEKQKIIYSNRLHKDLYRIDTIIEAFHSFQSVQNDWKLTVGAIGPNTESLKNQAKSILEKESFEFIGFVDRETNNHHYLKSHIWVSVPKSDGTAISLLEAMAYGCVPVVSDLPANREWVDDGVNGIIVQDDLSKSLEKAMELDQKTISDYNRKLILEKGSKDVNRQIFLDTYKDVLND